MGERSTSVEASDPSRRRTWVLGTVGLACGTVCLTVLRRGPELFAGWSLHAIALVGLALFSGAGCAALGLLPAIFAVFTPRRVRVDDDGLHVAALRWRHAPWDAIASITEQRGDWLVKWHGGTVRLPANWSGMVAVRERIAAHSRAPFRHGATAFSQEQVPVGPFEDRFVYGNNRVSRRRVAVASACVFLGLTSWSLWLAGQSSWDRREFIMGSIEVTVAAVLSAWPVVSFWRRDRTPGSAPARAVVVVTHDGVRIEQEGRVFSARWNEVTRFGPRRLLSGAIVHRIETFTEHVEIGNYVSGQLGTAREATHVMPFTRLMSLARRFVPDAVRRANRDYDLHPRSLTGHDVFSNDSSTARVWTVTGLIYFGLSVMRFLNGGRDSTLILIDCGFMLVFLGSMTWIPRVIVDSHEITVRSWRGVRRVPWNTVLSYRHRFPTGGPIVLETKTSAIELPFGDRERLKEAIATRAPRTALGGWSPIPDLPPAP